MRAVLCRRRAAGLILGVLLGMAGMRAAAAADSVKVWRETLTIPTYRTGEAERNPFFYFGRAYQGAQGPVYPYSMLDRLTDIREDRSYAAVFLENDDVRYCVLPGLGGRIFSAMDKTNGYDFIYRQHVIKPALIGMLGAWISGGAEWNIPHHHRATTFMPVDSEIQERPDGSKTVWIGELELRHRMRWAVGLTLYPGKSYLEVTFRIVNRTALAHSILCWANVAVHANADYQVVFPPGTRTATFHGKNQFSRWPTSAEVYNGVDYRPATDVSWWKNHPRPTSFFAWDAQGDFLAGYDHGRDAGVVFVADHHFAPGKKLWTWGTGAESETWEKILTDADGPYLELMVGAFSDNQPDYSWCQPYEAKTIKQYWYPLRKTGGLKAANEWGAVNLSLQTPDKALLRLNVTGDMKAARLVLKKGDVVVFEQGADLAAQTPFSAEANLLVPSNEEDLSFTLFDAQGHERLSFVPPREAQGPLPVPVAAPGPPKEIGSVEELYLAGLRLEQFYNPALEPEAYYEEALRRDPGSAEVNTAMGRLLLKRMLFSEAAERLERAVARLTKDYTRPKSGEALYYLGLAHRSLGQESSARDDFYRAAWDAAWRAPAFYQLAELACRTGDWHRALELVESSLSANSLNTKALDLKTTLLGRTGLQAEAEEVAGTLLGQDPLDFWALNEYSLARAGQGLQSIEAHRALMRSRMRDEVQNYLELATDYGQAGFWEDAVDILNLFLEFQEPGTPSNPLVYHYLGYYSSLRGQRNEALRFFRRAAEMPPDYCFPFRSETLDALSLAEKENPSDGRAALYLGNLLFDLQPLRAIEEWERAARLEPGLATVHRNLGLGYSRVLNDIPRAIRAMERSLECDAQDPRLYYELDLLYEAGRVAAQKRLAVLERNHEIVSRRDDSLSREIGLLVELGRLDRALELLKGHHFHVWEGGGEIHSLYVEACLARGGRFYKQRQFKRALADFESALEYPANLEVGRPSRGGVFARIQYCIGTAHEALGARDRALEYFRLVASADIPYSEASYYQGLAFRRLGEEEGALRVFRGLEYSAQDRLRAVPHMDFFAKFGERQSTEKHMAAASYLLGLASLGLGKMEAAKAALSRSVELDSNHFKAQELLADLQKRNQLPQ